MKISNHKFGKPFKRKLTLSNGTWSWRIAFTEIFIRSPDGCTTIHTDAYELNATTLEGWVRDAIDDESSWPSSISWPYAPTICPSDIRNLIETQFPEVIKKQPALIR